MRTDRQTDFWDIFTKSVLARQNWQYYLHTEFRKNRFGSFVPVTCGRTDRRISEISLQNLFWLDKIGSIIYIPNFVGIGSVVLSLLHMDGRTDGFLRYIYKICFGLIKLAVLSTYNISYESVSSFVPVTCGRTDRRIFKIIYKICFGSTKLEVLSTYQIS